MFLRSQNRWKNGKPHRYFSIVQNRRIAVAGETWRGPARRVRLDQYVGLGGGLVWGAVETGRWAVGDETGGHRSRLKMVATEPNPNLFPVEAGENRSAEQACLRSRRSLMQTVGRPMPRLRLLWRMAPTESICAL